MTKKLQILKNCFRCSVLKIIEKCSCYRVLGYESASRQHHKQKSYSSPLKARLGKHFLDENVKSVSIAFPPLPPQWRVKQSDRATWSFEPDKNVIPENAALWRQANLFRNELPLIGRVGESGGAGAGEVGINIHVWRRVVSDLYKQIPMVSMLWQEWEWDISGNWVFSWLRPRRGSEVYIISIIISVDVPPAHYSNISI